MRHVSVFMLAAALTVAAPAPSDATGCDRACLRGFITQYLAALVAHDPSRLPVAKNVRFTEDSVEKHLGEGLWQTATAIRPFRQDVLDVREAVAGTHAILEEHGAPVMLVLRLKIVSGKITEVETMVVRNRAEGLIFEPDALKAASPAMNIVPIPAQRATREAAIRIAERYPMGLREGSFVKTNVPFADGAYRLEGGRLMAGPGCTFLPGCENIRTQKIPMLPAITWQIAAVDEDLGIVWVWENFGKGSVPTPNMALVAWEMFKVYGGQIHAVEAFMKQMPDGTPRGWGSGTR
jgi:hypothetical protein